MPPSARPGTRTPLPPLRRPDPPVTLGPMRRPGRDRGVLLALTIVVVILAFGLGLAFGNALAGPASDRAEGPRRDLREPQRQLERAGDPARPGRRCERQAARPPLGSAKRTRTGRRASAGSRRRASAGSGRRRPGLDRDEYPPAASEEGGTGADVRSSQPGGEPLRRIPHGRRIERVLRRDPLRGRAVSDRGPLADHFTDLIAKIGEHCADDSDIVYHRVDRRRTRRGRGQDDRRDAGDGDVTRTNVRHRTHRYRATPTLPL